VKSKLLFRIRKQLLISVY